MKIPTYDGKLAQFANRKSKTFDKKHGSMHRFVLGLLESARDLAIADSWIRRGESVIFDHVVYSAKFETYTQRVLSYCDGAALSEAPAKFLQALGKHPNLIGIVQSNDFDFRNADDVGPRLEKLEREYFLGIQARHEDAQVLNDKLDKRDERGGRNPYNSKPSHPSQDS